MDGISFSYQDTCLVDMQVLSTHCEVLAEEIGRLKKARNSGYDCQYASVNLPFDSQMHQHVQSLVRDKQRLHPAVLIVIGIGGSNLGTLAIHQALHGVLHNESTDGLRVYFVDTVDADHSTPIYRIAQRWLERGCVVLLNVVTKSGATTETIANAQVFIDLLKRYQPDSFHEHVVVTTDAGSVLESIAHSYGFSVLTIPPRVGGRYSVFSSVGLFPLMLLGIDSDALRAGARAAVDLCLKEDVFSNPAALSALIISQQHKRGMTINDQFIFSVSLEAVGKWYRQLMAESIGKKHSVDGQKVETGITPTVSMGSVDLHSVAQLYLGGPRDKFTTFMTVAHDELPVYVPVINGFEQSVANIQGKSLSCIMRAMVQGVTRAYFADKKPFVSLELERKDEYTLGALLQFKMIEIMYLGYLLSVNPFDQPNVEQYKRETRALLAQE